MRKLILIILKRKSITKIILFLLLFFAIIYWINPSIVCFGKAGVLSGKKIVIDPGHGGIDGGTNCTGFLEKEINLAVAQKLKKELTKQGAQVILTREQDVDLGQPDYSGNSRHKRDLTARTSIIEKNKPDIFLSIHVNANHRRPSTSGSMVFYNKRILGAGDLSDALQEHLNIVMERHKLKKHKPEPADFYILRNSKFTGAMIELGFMTNQQEKELLKQDQYQVELCKGIVEGLKEYYSGQYNYTKNSDQEVKNNSTGTTVKLYFPNKITNCLDWETLTSKQVSLSTTPEQLIYETMEELIRGPVNTNLESVFDSRLHLRNVMLNNGIAELDLSKEFGNSGTEDYDEYMAVTSMVETLTQFPGVRGVKLLIEGHPVNEPLGDMDVSKVLTPKRPKAVIALVIDDLAGGDLGRKEIMSIKRPLTLSVLPRRKLSTQLAEEAYRKGYQVFLHLPMEPDQGRPEWLGEGAITTMMPIPEVRKTFLTDLSDVPHAVGFNNHMGSKVSKREDILYEILSIAKQKRLLVVDSKTTNDSIIPNVAKKLNMQVLQRTVFLDVNSTSIDYVKKQIQKLAEIAMEKGSGIGIGHVGIIGKNTPEGINEMLPWLDEQGIEIVFVSELFDNNKQTVNNKT